MRIVYVFIRYLNILVVRWKLGVLALLFGSFRGRSLFNFARLGVIAVGLSFFVGSLAALWGKDLAFLLRVFVLQFLVIFLEPRKRPLYTLPVMGFNKGISPLAGEIN